MIPAVGFCIHLRRVRQERRASKSYARTVGEYACYWTGSPIEGLTGQIVECGGPGDNTTTIGNARDLRINSGTYPLAIHDGPKYQTFGYSESQSHTATPKPGILLKRTGERSAILIHPGMDYVWSVGCLNPGSQLTTAESKINFVDSRRQVVRIIEAMKEKLGAKFPKTAGTTIPNAVIVIDGEPP